VRLRSAQGSLLLVVALVILVVVFDLVTRSRLSATPTVPCEGDYADTFQLLGPRGRQTEQGPRGQYSYLVRSSARYECPFFGPDGKLRRRRIAATELGTAFAYEVSGNDTYLLTNEHVAVWPEVTDGLHHVDGVPEGCKRVDDRLRIVRDERDDFEPGQISLTRVAVEPLLDAAILKAPQKLNVLPYKVGKSASLRQGDAIRVRGFPLGVMQAVSDGKIVNAYDRDQEQGWDHVDFVIDALLSEGNSGSPVLAVACGSRDLELVGLYHAGYKGHSALNVVIGIDQLTDFMKRKKRMPRALAIDASGGLGPKDRARLIAALETSSLPLFDFGGAVFRVDARPGQDHAAGGAGGAGGGASNEAGAGTLLYHIYTRQFPLDDRRSLVLEDLPKEGAFGEVGRMFVPAAAAAVPPATPWRAWPPSALGVEERELLGRAVDSIRVQVLRATDYRKTLTNLSSADERRRGRELSRAIMHDAVAAKDLANALLDMADRLSVGHDTPAPPSGSISEAPPAPPAPPSPAPPSVPDRVQ